LQVAIEYRSIKEERGIVNGVLYAWVTESGIVALRGEFWTIAETKTPDGLERLDCSLYQ
jgi:hypothetical protein